jgi:hypothetical protein
MQTAKPGTFDGFFTEFVSVSCCHIFLFPAFCDARASQVLKSFLSGLVTGVTIQVFQSWRSGKQ